MLYNNAAKIFGASYIKSMYDDYNDLYVVYTGSSMLEIVHRFNMF